MFGIEELTGLEVKRIIKTQSVIKKRMAEVKEKRERGELEQKSKILKREEKLNNKLLREKQALIHKSRGYGRKKKVFPEGTTDEEKRAYRKQQMRDYYIENRQTIIKYNTWLAKINKTKKIIKELTK